MMLSVSAQVNAKFSLLTDTELIEIILQFIQSNSNNDRCELYENALQNRLICVGETRERTLNQSLYYGTQSIALLFQGWSW